MTGDEHAARKLLAGWQLREDAPLLVSEDAGADEDLDPAMRARWRNERSTRIRSELLGDADMLMQQGRRVVAAVEAQGVHHAASTYLQRASLRATPSVLQRVNMASDTELSELAAETERQEDIALAGAVYGALGARGTMRPELRKATSETLARVRILEREAAVERAQALRDRGLQLQLLLYDRLAAMPRAPGNCTPRGRWRSRCGAATDGREWRRNEQGREGAGRRRCSSQRRRARVGRVLPPVAAVPSLAGT